MGRRGWRLILRCVGRRLMQRRLAKASHLRRDLPHDLGIILVIRRYRTANFVLFLTVGVGTDVHPGDEFDPIQLGKAADPAFGLRLWRIVLVIEPARRELRPCCRTLGYFTPVRERGTKWDNIDAIIQTIIRQLQLSGYMSLVRRKAALPRSLGSLGRS